MNDAPGPIDISPSPNAALVLDSQLRIVAVSDAYLQSRQTDRPALLGHEIRELLPDQPESELARRAALNMMEDAVAARQHAEAVNAQLQAEIAERRRAEAIVQESENYLRRFVERAPAAIAMLDRDLRYICASHRWLQDYRLGNQLISGRGHDEVFPQLPPHWRDVYRRCLGGAIEKGEEDMFPRPDGTVDWIRWEVVPWTDGDGNVGGIIISTESIAARKQADEMRAHLAAIVESSDDAIIGKTLAGVVTSWTKGAELVFGYTAREMVGQTLLRLLPPERAFEEASILSRVGRGETIDHFETVRVRGDGTRIDISATISPLRDTQGKLVGACQVTRDITARKRAAVLLQQANADLERKVAERTAELQAAKEQAETADRSKSNFLATMSHELRTPLNAIIGFTGTLLMRLPGPLTVDQEKQLRTVQSSARHLLSLLNDLLDLAKIEAGRIELRLEPVNCQQVIDEVVTTLRPVAEHKRLELRVQVPPAPITVQADRRSLSQIILNLTTNAIKFTDRGHVTIDLSQDPVAGQTCLRVSDTGIGIRPEHLPRLFHSFSQVHEKGTVHDGTGLGLYLSQKLAGLMGGTITVQSEPEKGSAFTLNLTPPVP